MNFALNFDSTEIRGDRTLRVKLSRPYAAFTTVDLAFLVLLVPRCSRRSARRRTSTTASSGAIIRLGT